MCHRPKGALPVAKKNETTNYTSRCQPEGMWRTNRLPWFSSHLEKTCSAGGNDILRWKVRIIKLESVVKCEIMNPFFQYELAPANNLGSLGQGLQSMQPLAFMEWHTYTMDTFSWLPCTEWVHPLVKTQSKCGIKGTSWEISPKDTLH